MATNQPPLTKWDRARRKVEIESDKKLIEQLTIVAEQSAAITLKYANSDGMISDTRKTRLMIVNQIWDDILKPYFIGKGSRPFIGSQPQSPYATGIYDGIIGVTTVTAQEQIAIVNKYTKDDPLVNEWLTEPNTNNPILLGEMLITEQTPGNPTYDPFHLFVYGDDPYTLSDRVWNTAIEMRQNIDNLLAFEIQSGKSAVDIAKILEQYLTPGAAGVTTNTPYGNEGSYGARRLSRTEITAAAGRSTLNASILNPYVVGDQWRLSASHPEADPCDTNASGGPNSDGIYKPENFPSYPNHPHELCTIIPIVTANPEAVTAQLHAQIEAELARELAAAQSNEINAQQGAFDPDWLIRALVFGWFIQSQTSDT